MSSPKKLRQGDIFWLENCPPLEGDQWKTRPVIVIFTPDFLEQEEAIIVAASTTVLSSERDRVLLPNLVSEPQTKTGLDKVCWAVPRWYFPIKPDRLTRYCGYLAGKKLAQLVAAVEKRTRE